MNADQYTSLYGSKVSLYGSSHSWRSMVITTWTGNKTNIVESEIIVKIYDDLKNLLLNHPSSTTINGFLKYIHQCDGFSFNDLRSFIANRFDGVPFSSKTTKEGREDFIGSPIIKYNAKLVPGTQTTKPEFGLSTKILISRYVNLLNVAMKMGERETEYVLGYLFKDIHEHMIDLHSHNDIHDLVVLHMIAKEFDRKIDLDRMIISQTNLKICQMDCVYQEPGRNLNTRTKPIVFLRGLIDSVKTENPHVLAKKKANDSLKEWFERSLMEELLPPTRIE